MNSAFPIANYDFYKIFVTYRNLDLSKIVLLVKLLSESWILGECAVEAVYFIRREYHIPGIELVEIPTGTIDVSSIVHSKG